MDENEKKLADEKIAAFQQQQKEMVLKKFDEDDAWKLGLWMRDLASKNGYPIGIAITLNRKKVFQVMMPNTAPLSEDWLRRKENTVYKFYKSTFEMAYFLKKNDQTVHSRYGLAHEDFAMGGGGIPITVEGVGVVGSVAVTGLPPEQDHQFAIDGLAYLIYTQG